MVTVFAGDPASGAPAGTWDAAAGFATAGEAWRARRDEDRRACIRLQAQPVWLPFPDSQYPVADRDDLSAALVDAVRDAPTVIVPGHPLEHPDHVLVTTLALEHCHPKVRLMLYAEQPYAWRRRGAATTPLVLADRLAAPVTWQRPRVGAAPRRRKRQAIDCYRSQLRLFGRFVPMRLAANDVRRGERVAEVVR